MNVIEHYVLPHTNLLSMCTHVKANEWNTGAGVVAQFATIADTIFS